MSTKVKTEKFVRKSFPVEAIQVTPDNMEQVAKWCAGNIQEDGEKEGHLSRTYIKVRVAYPINERQTQAYLGDWVLKSGRSFKVYNNSAFEKSFVKEPVAEKRAEKVAGQAKKALEGAELVAASIKS